MGDTWGISGPAFLGIYILLVVASALVAPVAVWLLDRRVARADGDAPSPNVTVEDLALLAGGPPRLVHAAIARLVEGGVLRVGRARHLTVTGRPPIGELDETVADTIAGSPYGLRTAETTMRMRGAPAVRDLQAAAQRRGLFHDPTAVARCTNLAYLVVGAVVLLGLVRSAAGLARGAPTVLLVVLMVFAAAVALTVLPFSVHRPTRRGRATLAAAHASLHRPAFATDRAWGPAATGTLGIAGMVAVGGLAMYPDAELAHLLAAPALGAGTGGSDGGGGYDGGSSCGSSSGGASSCGGGGGGGGGGCGG